MRRLPLYLAFSLGASLAVSHTASAQGAPAPAAAPAGQSCDPYQNYSCLDSYLGEGVFDRLANYYKLEWEQAGPPSDPNAPASRRDGWPVTPETISPMPFTEWPYGGTSSLGVTRPASVDSPLMVSIANTPAGKWMADAHIQAYGWVDVGGNISTSNVSAGNAPAAYLYNPNTITLDQAVLYLERLPDTVQSDHIDWGFRLSGIYGTNYRYTTAYGLWSYQLLNHNHEYGYDAPMVYGEVFIPQVMQGLMIRFGRYISLPDIEAQLAPNNYMYTHSMTYTFDNYTNTGIQSTLAVTKQLFLQLGVSVGTEAMPWHVDEHIANPYPNQIYPGTTFAKDPGAKPSLTACARYQTMNGKDDINVCANGINKGSYGYNNLQWYGLTYYHKFNDKWHVAYEAYYEHQNNVPNVSNPTVQTINANGGTPFTAPASGILANAPFEAQCGNSTVLTCTAGAYGTVAYLNYTPDARNNISFRPEFFWDKQGQRTGFATRYTTWGLGWQHWLSPQIELRPEVTYYKALNGTPFDGGAKDFETIVSGDVIVHF